MTTPQRFGLGRRVQFDPRSKDFPVRALFHPDQPPVSRRWYLPSTAPVLDQGDTSSCVGHGIVNDLRYTPIPAVDLDSRYAVESIYWPAQHVDPWDGGDYPGATPRTGGGTSVLAGMQVAKAAGWYGEYRWAFSELDLALSVAHVGPAILGLPWYEGMAEPDRFGFLQPTGDLVGGHCVLAIGVNVQGDGQYTILNSWGVDWGDRGRAKIGRYRMAWLLEQQGEACIPTRRLRPKPGPGR